MLQGRLFETEEEDMVDAVPEDMVDASTNF